MLSHSIQSTIYLYWDNYPEFKDIQKAVKFSQKIYMEHKQISKMVELSKKWANHSK